MAPRTKSNGGNGQKDISNEARLTKIETLLEVISEDVKSLRGTMPEVMTELKSFFQDFAGKYTSISLHEGLDTRVGELEKWKDRIDHDDDLCKRIEGVEDKISNFQSKLVGATAVLTILLPIVYYLINKLLDSLF